METENDHPVLKRLQPGETVRAKAEARDARILVTDRRVAIAADGRVALDLPIEGLRRIQFDIERTRPATLVIVPEDAMHEPQVLAIPPEQFDAIASTLAFIGRRLAAMG